MHNKSSASETTDIGVTFRLNEKFNLARYMGKWYELMHYPSWFQRNDNYNTTARYRLKSDGKVEVVNSTISNGKRVTSVGTATYLGANLLRVDFSAEEIQKLIGTGQFPALGTNPAQPNGGMPPNMDPSVPNYVIDSIWQNEKGEYLYAVVTDLNKESLYVLSRLAHPCLESYNKLMQYVITYFNRDRLVQTPHFD
jgi:lipocalin